MCLLKRMVENIWEWFYKRHQLLGTKTPQKIQKIKSKILLQFKQDSPSTMVKSDNLDIGNFWQEQEEMRTLVPIGHLLLQSL